MGREFEKLAEMDSQIDNYEKDREKVHEIALLEKNGKRPITCNGKELKNGLFLEVDRRMKVHLETWQTSEIIPARYLDIKKTESI